MSDQVLRAPSGELTLRRVPESKMPLRAWDRADQLLIDLVEGRNGEEFSANPDDAVLVVGDSFGALACALARFDPMVCIESAAGREALAQNLVRNDLDDLQPCSMLDLGDARSSNSGFDLVILRVPKSVAELRDLLHRLRPHLRANGRVLAAGMDKHLPPSVEGVLEEVIGPSTRHLATGRARHFSARFEPDQTPGENPWPIRWRAHGSTLINHGGGFSAKDVDSGTNFLLTTVADFSEHVLDTDGAAQVVDLGCGNGIVGLRVAQDFIKADALVEVAAVDDSFLAIDATEQSWEASTVRPKAMLQLHHAHRLAEVIAPESVGLIVVNPPFHSDRVITDETAWSMFVDAHRTLIDGGALIVVGNRHLAYHAKLAKIFGEVEVLGANNRFVVHRAIRAPRNR